MIAIPQTVSYYRAKSGHAYFEEWFESLDARLQRIVAARLERMANGNFGDCKPYDEIFELRIHDGPGYRVFFGREGSKIVVLLTGSSKRDQHKAASKAVELWHEYLESKS